MIDEGISLARHRVNWVSVGSNQPLKANEYRTRRQALVLFHNLLMLNNPPNLPISDNVNNKIE